MSTITALTKKMTELTEITEVDGSMFTIVHDGDGMRIVSLDNFKADLNELIDTVNDTIAPLIYDNAGAHNAIYRGKSLGSSVTDEQWEAIFDGTFEDMYIGDYWTIDSVNYRIAAFNYYYKCGDTSCTTNHVVLVPDTCILTSQVMNESATTEGGYTGSYMYTDILPDALTIVETAFGSDHILTHRLYLSTAVTSGYISSASWYDSQIELMNEQMVYGGAIRMPMGNGSTNPNNTRVSKSQLPLFQHRHDLIGIRTGYWLRDVCSASNFACVTTNGNASYNSATTTYGVRPAFSIC